jgi:hypothetical protein
MFIVSNGAFKSGSTWVTLIVKQLGPFTAVPKEYCDETWAKDSILPARMADFLAQSDLAAADYMIKSHYKPADGMRPVLLAHPAVRILNIYRDPKDVVVSAYFHHRRHFEFKGSFSDFYEERAERLVRQLTQYHLYWNPDGHEDQIFFTTYQKLHRQFDDEVFRLGRFLGLDLTDETIALIRDKTDFSKLHERNKTINDNKFFRKGVMGDWLEHMTPEQGARLDQIEAQEGIYLVQDPILY